MIPKTLHLVLIAFWLICAGCQQNTAVLPAGAHNARATAEFSQQDGQSKPLAGEKKNPDENLDESTVIAYYFHRTIRCVACITVEVNAAAVIENSFQRQIADGRLMWMRVNLDDDGGEEYERQFEVSGSALVIAKAGDGNQLRQKKLTKVWELLSDQQALSEYVENEINEYLNR
ncbi:MAG TPA: nitrophenyl compound nitroreductase subunit ArsF family protein [Sedimentisphaerales bacterium]|nr:nitrophenyl compound nitroreductase subunit ArsF family protein [Sedimentisphaerales bacterium]